MSRRSKRIADKATTTIGVAGSSRAESESEVANHDPVRGDGLAVEDGESTLYDSDVEQDSDYSNNTKTKRSAVKRKRAKRNSAPGPPSAKKRRGTRGYLKDLLDMNVDILHEIFGYLDPLDLLYLARTCKMTREFLMSKDSRSIWKSARSNIIPSLPECPDDLSEPQYANLAFEKHCHFCLRNLKSVKIVWAARLRICTQCMDGRFISTSRRDLLNRIDMQELFYLVPTAIVPVGRSGKIKGYVYYSLEQQWKMDYEAAENKQEWLKKKITQQRQILSHSDDCEIWHNKYQDYLVDRQLEMVWNRAELIEDRLAEMGWGEEISHMRESEISIISQNILVMLACQRDLTESVIQSLLPILEQSMEEYRKERSTQKIFEVLLDRIPILQGLVDTYRSTIRPDAVALDIGDIFNHPEVLDFMVNSQDIQESADLDPIHAKMPAIVQQLQVGIEDQLVTMVEASCGSKHGLERTALLSLATTTFKCSLCDNIRFPRVLVHRCATQLVPQHYKRSGISDESRISAHLTNKTAWNANEQIMFNAWAHKILVEVVALCGFDPATTSFSQMAVADPIFECHDCNDPHFGRFMLQWDAVPTHLMACHHGISTLEKLSLFLLPEEQAQLIRVRMHENVARKRAESIYSGMACTRCHIKGNSVSLRTHAMSEHGVSDPSEEDGDFVVTLDSPNIQRTYRAWPPRKEGPKTSST